MRLFPASFRRRRSHGHRHYSTPNLHDFSIDSLVTLIDKPLGVHHIRKKLYSLPLQRLKSLFDVSRISCLIPIHQNIESLASFLMSLTTGYTDPYLPIHILKRKESFEPTFR